MKKRMIRSLGVLLGTLLVLGGAVAAPTKVIKTRCTLDEKFPNGGVRLGQTGKSWPAADLVGDNRGSYFFDVVFDEGMEPKSGSRNIFSLRTSSRTRICWTSYGNDRFQFSFTDIDTSYRVDFPGVLEKGKTLSFGVTWDGDTVRLYKDGLVVGSAAQPLKIAKSSVTSLFMGPFSDSWLKLDPWPDDVLVSRVRVWNNALTPAEVAVDAGLELKPLAESCPTKLVVPTIPSFAKVPKIDGLGDDEVWKFGGALPQLVRTKEPGKSGLLPEHNIRLLADTHGLYALAVSRFPPHIKHSPDKEAFSLVYRGAGKPISFAVSSTGKSTGKWKTSVSKSMNIDDSETWTAEAFIAWSTLGLKGAPTAMGAQRFTLARNWTFETVTDLSTVDVAVKFAAETPGLVVGKRTNPSSGTYMQNFTVATPKKAKLTYEVSLASRDGKLPPMSVYHHDYALGPGETSDDTLKFESSAPGYDALVHVFSADGKTVFQEAVPFDPSNELMDVFPLFTFEKVRVKFRRPFSGRVALKGGGKELASAEVKDGGATLAFPRKTAAGTCTILAFPANGNKAIAEKKFHYPGIGAWEKQNFQTDKVLPPFKPLETKVAKNGFASALSGRVYGWRDSLLPARIKSRGEQLLAAPAEILLDGQPVRCAEFAVPKSTETRVDFTASGTSRGGKAELVGWLEYDGTTYYRVTVRPKGDGEIAIRYRLDPKFAKYLHAASGAGWGAKKTCAIPDGSTEYGGYSTFWTGNEEKGVSFFTETKANWNGPANSVYRLEKGSDGLTVTVTVSERLADDKPFTFEFGLVATPVRPFAENYPYDTLGFAYSSFLNRPGKRPVTDLAQIVADDKHGGDLGSYFADLPTNDGRKSAEAIRYIIDHHISGTGSRPIPYTCARYLSVLYPEANDYRAEWTFRPEVAMDYDNSGHILYDCCPTTRASDFFVWEYKKLLKKFPEIRGIYFDFGTVHRCSNADHGCQDRIPILAQREFYRRMIVAQLEAGIESPVVVLHNTDCVQIPAMNFATHLLNGEHIRQASSTLLHDGKDILDSYDLSMFACELSSLPWGISNAAYFPYDNLSEKNGGRGETVDAYQFRMGKASMGACLVHNTMQSMWRNHFGLFDKVIRRLDAFGVGANAKFVGYWRKPATVTGGGDGTYVSFYTTGQKLLAVIAHLHPDHFDHDIEVTIDPDALGLKGSLKTATDLLTASDPNYDWLFERRRTHKEYVFAGRVPLELGDFGTKVISFDGRKLTYHLPYHTFGLVELK